MVYQFNYPQRWLREHEAIPSVKGWERMSTGEILKCQKGLLEDEGLFPRMVFVKQLEEITTVNSGDPINLKIEVDGGVHPLKYVWKNNDLILTNVITDSYTLTSSADVDTHNSVAIQCTVTDSFSSFVITKTIINVYNTTIGFPLNGTVKLDGTAKIGGV